MLKLTDGLALAEQKDALAEITHLDQKWHAHFKDVLHLQASLSRSLVSFQANKARAVYRWYKFKEAFSASLIEYLLEKYKLNGKLLDPFAGSGTTLFASSGRGIDADGIELLPIGQQIIAAKKLIDTQLTPTDTSSLKRWMDNRPWEQSVGQAQLNELRITKNAYSEETKQAIEKYIAASRHENERVQMLLQFALLCVLESISYTRKDGQYLRWDYRSGRRQGAKLFDKGIIPSFTEAILDKLNEILLDLQTPEKQFDLFQTATLQGRINLFAGSCLDVLPLLPNNHYDGVITSPPYCNRYDYTRTYALELALLGIDEKSLTDLRQQMLSCTVENRPKELRSMNSQWTQAISTADQQNLLQAIIKYLDHQKAQGVLNNNGIPRMVRGYFYEMTCVIYECARVLKPGAPLIMVNDNVRYAGASISVDIILSSLAEKLGFVVQNILILPGTKGNSSQQMGEHGRQPLRKSVYVWRKI